MYVRITRGRVDPARYDEAVTAAQEIARAASRLPGFRSYHGGADKTTGEVVAVSVWDSEASARFSREDLGEAYTRFQALNPRLDPPDIFELVAQA
jgi:heme-degrading monooxygenase HmoA